MEIGDLEEIQGIETVSFRFPWSLAIFRHYLLDTPYFEGLVARGSPEGSRKPLLAYIAYIAHGKEYHIINLAVHPDHRREGVATCLMEHLASRGVERVVDRITLEVRVSNGPAIEFYRSAVFLPCP
jgi:ribosomal-protein-alanine N-acetyltransferase